MYARLFSIKISKSLSSAVAVRHFNVKSTTKLGFPCSYTEEETRKILNTLNGQDVEQLYKYDISKSRLKRIDVWRRKFGTFISLDQVLELDGFGITVLRKFYDSIVESPKDVNSTSKLIKKDTKCTIPFFPTGLISKVSSCVSLYIGLDFVTWAKFQIDENQPTVLTGWNSFAISDRKLLVTDLIRIVTQINQLIPEADVYVVENPAVAQTVATGSALKTNISIQKSQLNAMVMLMLSNRPTEDPDLAYKNVYFLKQFISARLFGIYVGTERVSSETVVRSLMEHQVGLNENNLENIQSKLSIPSGLKVLYEEHYDAEREFLGQSLLLGLSFLRLCVFECENSLSVLRKR
ncbi:uncharacterized protein LOC131692016 [Topomyia yanbarensis]|uniref:uncharacterized protein LOC131692016 n=1 Tax=Topomyia yanbarensis TaxID=2498891 RepID=UPI00273CD6A6|nr:uncharacterized protein LOC131692016 [Topomyia yanbarensis]